MPGPGEINGSQPFKLTIEGYNRASNVANGGARANAPAALNNAQPAAAPQPAVAQAQQPRRGFFAWIMSWFSRAEPAPAPAPRVNPPQVPPHKQFNDNLVAKLRVDNFAALPQNFKDALTALAGELRAKFGTKVVPEGRDLCDLLPSNKCKMARMEELAGQANTAGREITADELVREYAERADLLFVGKLIGEKFADLCRAENVALDGSPLSLGTLMARRHPEMAQELRACQTSAELTQVLDKHAEKFSALVETRRAINEAMAMAENSCHEKLATALGLNKCLISSMVETAPLRNAIMDLGNQILAGTAPGSKEPGFSAKEALGNLSDDFVNARTGYLAEIDSLQIDDGVKQRWKAGVLNARSQPVLRPAQVMQLAGAIDLGKLEGALGGGLPLALRCDILTSLNRELGEAVRSALGEEGFRKLGGDELLSLTSFAVDIALSGKPELLQKVKDAKALLRDEVGPDMSRSNNVGGTYFVSSLVGLAQTAAEKPLTAEDRFRAAVEKQIDAALADSGVTDAKALADAKAALAERGRAILKSATSLAELSNYVDSLKAAAPKLAKLLDAVIKTRAEARNNIVNTIVGATRLGKGFVLNNLDTSNITSDSGKLRFLYMDIMSDARNGKAIDYQAMEDKANSIVAGFAIAKSDMLNTINKAGFEPVDRANHLMTVLKNGTFKDRVLVSVVKDLAENNDIRSALKSIAELTRPEVAETLDAHQLGLTFKILAKAFQIAIKANPEAAEKMAESSDAQQFLQTMLISQLSKDFPELPVNMAKLSHSGRLVQIREDVRLEMHDLHTLQVDYMTLEPYDGQKPPESVLKLVNTPNLVYDRAKHEKCTEDYAMLNLASIFFGGIAKGLPTEGKLADVDKFVANKLIGGGIVKKYSEGLSNEAIPILQNLVNRLDWRPNSAMDSDAIVKDFVENLKEWSDVAPGSKESKGLENVMQRREGGYLKDALKGETQQGSFVEVGGTQVFQTFFNDIDRNKYVVNGKTVSPKLGKPQMVDVFKQALGNDPAKLKAVSVVMNQQLFGEFTASLANRIPLVGWRKDGLPADESLENIPYVRKFASHDIETAQYLLYQEGAMSFEIDVAPDGKSATIRAKAEPNIYGHMTLLGKGNEIGKCIITQEFTLEFGDEPTIKNLKIGQTLA